ncbi:MAG: hypothetical protein HQK75_16420 [Candidatus Magnetomorum sp.]|nr:hypothetical protein [Candidatus Magnetomorum sp.]
MLKNNTHMDKKGLTSFPPTNLKKTGNCIPPEEMIVFNNRKFGKKRTKKIFAHLDSCPECYMRWLEFPAMPEPKLWVYLKKVSKIQFFSQVNITKPQVIPVLIMSLILVFMYFQIKPDDPPALSVLEKSDLSLSSLTTVLMPWEQNVSINFAKKGFLDYQRVFATGMWTARHDVLKEKDDTLLPDSFSVSSDTIAVHQCFYYLGRWCVLMNVACNDKNKATQFWKAQSKIITMLHNDMNTTDVLINASKSYIIQELTSCLALLKSTDKFLPSEKSCYLLSKHVNQMIGVLMY